MAKVKESALFYCDYSYESHIFDHHCLVGDNYKLNPRSVFYPLYMWDIGELETVTL